MAKRKPIGNKLRFDVLKRDGFTCQYCGKKPPEAVLEVDHIQPVFSGGTNAIVNLITSCFECNRGKGKNDLDDSVPGSLSESVSESIRREQLLKEYDDAIKANRRRVNARVRRIERIFQETYEDSKFTPNFRRSVASFLDRLPETEVETAMDKACLKVSADSQRALKYFCGVCWGMIKGAER